MQHALLRGETHRTLAISLSCKYRPELYTGWKNCGVYSLRLLLENNILTLLHHIFFKKTTTLLNIINKHTKEKLRESDQQSMQGGHFKQKFFVSWKSRKSFIIIKLIIICCLRCQYNLACEANYVVGRMLLFCLRQFALGLSLRKGL